MSVAGFQWLGWDLLEAKRVGGFGDQRGERHVCTWHPCECFAGQRKQKYEGVFLFESNLSDGRTSTRVVLILGIGSL